MSQKDMRSMESRRLGAAAAVFLFYMTSMMNMTVPVYQKNMSSELVSHLCMRSKRRERSSYLKQLRWTAGSAMLDI